MRRVTTASPRHAAASAREQRHRRLLLLAIGALLLLAMSPLFGHHLGRQTDALFAGRDHLGALCLIALHHLAEPVHRLFHILFLAGVAYALWDRVQAWTRVRRTLGLLPTSASAQDGGIAAAARDVGLPNSRVRVLRRLPSPAFTVGWLRPRVYVAAELESALSPDQLRAVLAHEAEHVRRRDPLRLSLLRFVSLTLFWLPALRRLADDFADDAEIVADDAATAGRPLVLASAILALAEWGQPRSSSGGTAFDERDLLERRIRRLAGEETPPRSRLTRRSLLAAGAALMLVWASGAAVAHPLPDGLLHASHCVHPDAAPWTHLTCGGGNAHRAGDVCLHGTR
jgi:Zn-dependent protease with chaperone function